MGLMTRDEMRDEVKAAVNRSDLDTLIETWLYRGVVWIGSHRKMVPMQATDTLALSIGDDEVSKPSDYRSFVRCEYHDSSDSALHVIAFKDIKFVREYWRDVQTLPRYIAPFGTKFYFDCEVDQAYNFTLYYRSMPSDFANGSATSPFEVEWDEALLLFARAKAFNHLRNWQNAQESWNAFFAYVNSRISEIETDDEQYNEPFATEDEYDPAVTGW